MVLVRSPENKVKSHGNKPMDYLTNNPEFSLGLKSLGTLYKESAILKKF